MATPYALSDAWSLSNRHVATNLGAILLGNTGGHDLRWTRTQDDVLPVIAPGQSHILRPGDIATLTLASGDRLWLAADPGGTALID